MFEKRRGQILPRLVIFTLGIAIMSFGIVLQIKANIGVSPWDVLHIGLYNHLGLTIGTWSIIAGIIVVAIALMISKESPQVGLLLNMILLGLFMDLFLWLPFLTTPSTTIGKITMLISGIIIHGYGMGIYISAQLGAGPRDSLMIALTSKTGWQVKYVRTGIELIVLLVGWLLGGPVYWGTILLSVSIGYIAGFSLPQCEFFTAKFLKMLNKYHKTIDNTKVNSNRGASL